MTYYLRQREKREKGKSKGKLPGEKYCKDLKLGQMIEQLVENKIIKNFGVGSRGNGEDMPAISDFKGAFDYLGHIKLAQLHRRRDKYGRCVVPEPSYPQIRQNLTEYAILPNGSKFVKSQTPHIRSILLYGPAGVGKTMLVEAVASHLNAIILDLSVTNVEGKFQRAKQDT